MNELLQTVDELRKMSEAELTQLGEESLLNHLRHQAMEARSRHGGLSPENLDTFLNDRDCVRHPTRLILEYGEMSPHQFAEPDRDYRTNLPEARVLYLRPVLGKRPDLVVLAVSYMIPSLNFGDIISDEHCLEYGALLMGLDPAEYYDSICELAEFVGAEICMADEAPSSGSANHSAPGCDGCTCR